MATPKPIPILSAPGIKRDGTRLDGDNYIDAQWCRFQRGLPRKMWGYQTISQQLPEAVYGISPKTINGINYLHLGSATKLTQVQTNRQGVFINQADRTPTTLVNDSDNLWTFTYLNDGTSATNTVIVAMAAPNLSDISSTAERNIFSGNPTATIALTATGMDPTSGGVIALNPYLLSYGNGGRIDVSAAGSVAATAGTAFVTGSKIVAALPLRGGGTGPSALFWSIDSLVRATFLDASLTVPFAFDEVSTSSSIMSSRSVVEYDGIYYWAGIDRFLSFNGVQRELPNQMNCNWFFDNLNMSARQKVFAFINPRWGEIWWCYPRGNATECTHAVIYNVRENSWYDTALPSSLRSDGAFCPGFGKPYMVDPTGSGGLFTLWQHETGVDEITGSSVNPIQSYFETNEISIIEAEEAVDKCLRVSRVEPDFVQVGDMTLTVKGRANSRSTTISSSAQTFEAIALTSEDQTVNWKEERRLLSFRFESNTQGGDYQTGKCIGHVEPTSGRILQ